MKSDIRIAYEFLIKYVMTLKAAFEKTYAVKYSSENVSPGYMDFTYFPLEQRPAYNAKILCARNYLA